MKLLATSLLSSTTLGGTFDNLYAQHKSLNTAHHLVKKLNMITERRIFPELVAIEEGGFSLEEQDEYEGHYAMEQPNVNFLLDFGNEELVKFRVHTQTYQQKGSYLGELGWGGAKKSGYGQSAAEDDDRDEDEWYKKYQDNHLERYTRPTRANLLRRIASQEMMIQYKSKTKRRFGAFFNYGCHCFPGSFIDPRHSPHAQPVDDIDKACREHSWAYDCAKQDFGNDCRGKYQLYNWVGTLNADGYTHEITCTDQVDSCAWAICEADKHLATRLSELPYEYRDDYLVNPQDTSVSSFDRVQRCNLQQVEDTARDEHNNNENVYLNDAIAQPAEPAAPVAIVQSAVAPPSYQEPALPAVPASPADLSAERGIPEFASFAPAPVEQVDAFVGEQAPVSNEPNWGAMTLEERRKWADLGYEIPEEFKPPPEIVEVYQPSGNLIFGSVPAGPQEPVFADIAAPQPAFTHASTEAPATVDELNVALAAVTEQAINHQLYGDNANNMELNSSHIFEEEPAQAPPAVEEVEEIVPPEIIMKAAVTHHYRKCCGQYPKRYKYSTNRMGCCNDNGIERLYSPSHAKCCLVKSSRATAGTNLASYLTHIAEDCDDALN